LGELTTLVPIELDKNVEKLAVGRSPGPHNSDGTNSRGGHTSLGRYCDNITIVTGKTAERGKDQRRKKITGEAIEPDSQIYGGTGAPLVRGGAKLSLRGKKIDDATGGIN